MGREGDGIKGEGRREGQGGGGKAPRERVGCIIWRDGEGREEREMGAGSCRRVWMD